MAAARPVRASEQRPGIPSQRGTAAPRADARSFSFPVPAGLTYDVVQVRADHGRRVAAALPRLGTVYASTHWWRRARADWWLTAQASWWLLVPPDSDAGLAWPATARYWRGPAIHLPAGTHPPQRVNLSALAPADASGPYTAPLPLYVALCRLAGRSVTPLPPAPRIIDPGGR
jgi:hypothetical protein